MLSEDSSELNDWQTSSYCGDGACVAVALTATAVHVRNTTDPTRTQLRLTHSQFSGLLTSIKADGFDPR